MILERITSLWRRGRSRSTLWPMVSSSLFDASLSSHSSRFLLPLTVSFSFYSSLTELDAAARGPATVNRRRSSRSLLSRPISALTTTSGQSPPLGGNSYSPSSNSFALSITPPFALASSPSRPSPLHHQHSSSLTRPLSIPQVPQSVTNSPVPQQSSVSSGNSLIPSSQRYSSSPGTVGALARALSAASGRLFGTSPSSPGGGAGVVARATARRKALLRSGEVDAAEEALILLLEDLSQKAIVVIELADSKVGQILHQGGGSALATSDNSPGSSSGFQLYLSGLAQKETKRRSSSNANSNSGSDSSIMRTDVVAAEAVSLYIAALALLQRGVIAAKSFLESQNGTYDASSSGDLNEGERNERPVRSFPRRVNRLLFPFLLSQPSNGSELASTSASTRPRSRRVDAEMGSTTSSPIRSSTIEQWRS